MSVVEEAGTRPWDVLVLLSVIEHVLPYQATWEKKRPGPVYYHYYFYYTLAPFGHGAL